MRIRPRSKCVQGSAGYPLPSSSSHGTDTSPVSAELPSYSRKSQGILIIGVVVALILAIFGGVTGAFAWGSQAVDRIHITCASSSVYFPDPYTSGDGSLEVGVINPSPFDADANWNIIIAYPGGATFTSAQAFHVPANSKASPVFYFDVNNSEAGGMTGNPTIIVNAEYHALVFSYSHQFYQQNAASC